MSSSLLKRSLAIAEEDLQKNSSTKKKLKNQNFMEPTMVNSIPQNYQIFGKTKFKGKSGRQNLLKQERKLTVEEIRKNVKQSKNKTQENIEKLLKLSSTKLDEDTTEKIIKRAQTGHYIIPEKEPIRKEESIFTEKDFQDFEKEYFAD